MLLKDCPISATLRCIGGKWKPMILRELKTGQLRFGQLQRHIPEASHKVLTDQLRELERSGIITRSVHTEAVRRSVYALSPLGETLLPALRELAKWGTGAKKRERMKAASRQAESSG